MAEAGEPLAAIPGAIEARARRLLERACEREIAIVTAESCTGGLLAALLTDIEGASSAFERGFVVYASEAKCELLGIEAALIDRCGAVSEEVAVAMARGALAASHGDVAIGITGVRPGGRAPTTRRGWSTWLASTVVGRPPIASFTWAKSAGGPYGRGAWRSPSSCWRGRSDPASPRASPGVQSIR